jgi:predicted metal-dependent hydrolase
MGAKRSGQGDGPQAPDGVRRLQARFGSWALVAFAALAVALALGLVGNRYYALYRDARAGQAALQEAQSLLRERGLDVSADELAIAESRLVEAEERLRAAWRRLDGDGLAALAGRLPWVGDQLTAARELLAMGVEAGRVGRLGIDAAGGYLEVRDRQAGPLSSRARTIIDRTRGSMTAVAEYVKVIRARQENLREGALLPPLASAVRSAREDTAEVEELVQTYQDAADFLPRFLGFDRPRTYFVLAQNNAELLPTGGLISVYGLMTLRDGRVEEMFFEDAIAFGERWQERTGHYIEPPAPLRSYLLKDWSWNLALANWSPDFPTAARQALTFFELGGGTREVDGVLAINVATLEELLKVTGPVEVSEYGVTVDHENVLEVTEALTRSPLEPGSDRKAFVAFLAEEVLDRLMETPPSRWSALLETLERLRDSKNVLFYSEQPDLQAPATRMGLDGALRQPEGDYLMLVDASVNSTKLNIVLHQEVSLTAELDELGNARIQLEVAYRNDLPAWERGRDPVLVKRLMLGGMYGGYLRLFAASGARLLEAHQDGAPAGVDEVSAEMGHSVFGRFFAVPSGESRRLSFAYVAPAVVRPDGRPSGRVERGVHEYRLFLQKQPGTAAVPWHLRIVLPEGARVLSVELDGEARHASDIDLSMDLGRDREVVVRYRLLEEG